MDFSLEKKNENNLSFCKTFLVFFRTIKFSQCRVQMCCNEMWSSLIVKETVNCIVTVIIQIFAKPEELTFPFKAPVMDGYYSFTGPDF